MRKPAIPCLILGLLLVSQGWLGAQDDKKEPPKKVVKVDGQTLDFWVAQLKDPDAAKRQQAAKALATARGLARKSATKPALEMLASDDPYSRRLAVYILENIKADPKLVIPELVKVVGDKDATLRRNAAFALVKSTDKEAVEALSSEGPKLANLLATSEIADVRQLAAYTLGNARKMESDEVMKALLKAVLTDKSPGVRKASAEALARRARKKPELVVAELIPALKDKDPAVRRAVAGTLVIFRAETRKHVPPLRELLLKGEKADERGLAAFVLGNIAPKKEEIVEALKTSLKTEQISQVVTQVQNALKEIDPIAADMLGIK